MGKGLVNYRKVKDESDGKNSPLEAIQRGENRPKSGLNWWSVEQFRKKILTNELSCSLTL